MFLERKHDQVIVFVGNHTSGQKIKVAVVDGDSVVLWIGKERVLVRNIVAKNSGQYRGVIYGFEPGFAVEHNGLVLDQDITFSEKHIFGCQST